MLNFFAGAFAVAGLIAAVGPILIHLLNRRRFRTVEWAAMDFLREAMQRNRRVMQMRDLILLLLRVLAVALVGLALARPFFSSSSDDLFFRYVWTGLAVVAGFGLAIWAVLSSSRGVAIAGGLAAAALGGVAYWGVNGIARAQSVADGRHTSSQPVHAVLVLDNSASMGYETLDGGNLLARAREKAAAFLDKLPPDSRVSVLPLCGSPTSFSFDAYRSREDAKEALERIPVVDRGGAAARITNVVDLATEACRRVPELPAKRVVFLSDQQLSNWPADSLGDSLEKLPELQVVQVAAEDPSNVWVEDFTLQDGIADTETPAVFLGTVRLEGPAAVEDVAVSLEIEGVPVATRHVELEPGQEARLRFKYELDVPTEPGRPNFVTAELKVAVPSARADGLLADNTRHLVIPVVASLPVVFIDTVGGDNEELDAGEIGETLPLRRLLAPVDSRDDPTRQLVRVRHITMEELDRELLADARLVVVAGIETPGTEDRVEMLREYVCQGGRLAILAGGDFDPIAWNDLGWKRGAGILPAPLEPETVGKSFDEISTEDDLQPFFLDFDTMLNRWFQLELESLDDLADLYRLPVFTKAVAVKVGDDVLEELVEAETERIATAREFLVQSDERRSEWEAKERDGTLTDDDEAARAIDAEERQRIEPAWLTWDRETVGDELAGLEPVTLAERSRPRVLAAYTGNGLPFLVTRTIDRGRVWFFTSGVRPQWNTLAGTSAMAMFARILGIGLGETLPQRNFETGEPVILPARPGDAVRYTIRRGYVVRKLTHRGETEAPEGELLTVEAVGPDEYGVVVRNAFHTGSYVIREADEGDTVVRDDAVVEIREIPLAVNGPREESDLSAINAEDLTDRLGEGANYRWIAPNEEISLEGAEVRGRNLWKLAILAVLVCLLVEMFVLALPALRGAATLENGGDA